MKNKIREKSRIAVGYLAKSWWGGILAIAIVASSFTAVKPVAKAETLRPNQTAAVKDSIDQRTGLVLAPGFSVVSTTCVRCHSPKLITEKRATREGWLGTIRWMQQTQGLWDLGKDEPQILDYLAKHYAPKNEGRRPQLKVDKWYPLQN